ncbi:MAG: hypothetical protein WAK60_11685 [Sedimentisphaerales bacterium]
MAEITKKKCKKCGGKKPHKAFSKNKKSPDGLVAYCKSCMKIYQAGYKKRGSLPISKTCELHDLECTCKKCEKRSKQIYKNKLTQKNVIEAERLGIQSWNQIDSVLQEMAELQSRINDEEANCEERISLIKKYSEEIIDPWIAHQITLQIMLQNFLRKDGRKRLIRKYCFGTIKLFRGQLKIQFNVDLAKQRMGKP